MGLREDIQETIDYAKRFDCPINGEEICERLISKKIYKTEEIKKELRNFTISSSKNKWEKIKIKKAKEFEKLIKNKFKDILFLGISGSVAAGYPKKNDDIDLMIITKKNKLWLTRFKLRWFIFINRIPHRKYGQKENKNEFCFNLWLDGVGLKLPKNKQNLKNATDLIMLKPLINKQGTYEKFILINNWVKKYLSTGYINILSDCQIVRLSDKTKRKENNYLDQLINKLFFWPQYWYMNKKITNEKISYHQAFFHK